MFKEAEAHHATQAYDLEKSHVESMLKLKCEVLAEEGYDCQAFMEACGEALWACVPQCSWGADVSPAAPYWQCATGHHAGYHPSTGHSRLRTVVNSLPTYSV